MRNLFVVCLIILALPLPLPAAEDFGGLQQLSNLRLVPHPANDADSFHVTDGESQWLLRLYFVDAPETGADSETMVRRLREQTRYFGLTRHSDTIQVGQEATAQVETWLAKPFTAYTAFADAMGRSTEQRFYAFVVTAGGEHLDQLLVENGLARSFGLGRRDHEGTPRDEREALLRDLEASAMLRRAGVWAYTDPLRLAALRAEERREGRELATIRAELGLGNLAEGETICLNSAPASELQRLPGVGPVLAGRMANARPYQSVESLLQVSGIGPATLERLRPYLTISEDGKSP